jgi:hypothetical protein
MTSRRILHPAIPSPEPEAAFDFEAFADRMHLGDEVFQSHGSAPNLEVEESWTRAESERLNEYVSGRRAA